MNLLRAALLVVMGVTLCHGQVTPGGKKFADELVRAGWSGQAAAGGVTISCRNVALFSEAGLNALSHVDQLKPEEQKAFRDFGRFQIDKPVFAWGQYLNAGSYRLGVDRDAHGALGFDVRSQAGSDVLAQDGVWIRGSFSDLPSASASQSGGKTTATLSFGSLGLEFLFFDEEAVKALRNDLEKYRSEDGSVTLWTDLPWAEGLQALADEAAAAIPEYSKRLDGDARAPYDILVFSKYERYESACQFIASGDFVNHGGFTSHNSGEVYIHFPGCDAKLLADGAVPLWLRAIVLHELHHLMTRDTHPRTVSFWPTWVSEGLCETATEMALALSSKADARFFEGLRTGSLRGATLRGGIPALEDIFSWQDGDDQTTMYSSGYQLVATIQKRGRLLSQVVEDLRRGGGPETLGLIVSQSVANEFGGHPEFYDSAISKKIRRSKGLDWRSGYYDKVAGWHRLFCAPGRSSQVLFPDLHAGGEFRLVGELAFLPDGKNQSDIYFGHRGGARSSSFYQLAIMTNSVVLFRYTTDSGFTRVGTVNFDDHLEIGTATKPIWQRWTLTVDEDATKIRWEHDNGRWAQFTPQARSMIGTRHGIGVYGGMGYFRKIVKK